MNPYRPTGSEPKDDSGGSRSKTPGRRKSSRVDPGIDFAGGPWSVWAVGIIGGVIQCCFGFDIEPSEAYVEPYLPLLIFPVLCPAVCGVLLPGSVDDRVTRFVLGGAVSFVGLFLYVPTCVTLTAVVDNAPVPGSNRRLALTALVWLAILVVVTLAVAYGVLRPYARRVVRE